MLFIHQIKDDDDKYAKAKAKTQRASSGVLSKYHDALLVTSTAGRQVMSLLGRGSLAYLCFLMTCGMAFTFFGGRFDKVPTLPLIGWVSSVAESLGLLVLQQKIVTDKSVAGISKMTMQIYAFVYVFREGLLCPPFTFRSLHTETEDWMVEWLCLPSIVMVFATLWSFKTYRGTYQEDLDVLKTKYIFPACIVLAFLIPPDVKKGAMGNALWAMCMYADTVALMPQIVMMVRGKGKVAAPIAHFVAATALSRCVDLSFWYWGTDLIGYWSVVLIVLLHTVSLLLIADFMYYYLKARLAGSSVTEDLAVAV